MYSYIIKYQISVVIRYSRAFRGDDAAVGKWSSKATKIQNFEENTSPLRELNSSKLNDVDQRVTELQKKVWVRLSDIQLGLEVWTFTLQVSIFAYCSYRKSTRIHKLSLPGF